MLTKNEKAIFELGREAALDPAGGAEQRKRYIGLLEAAKWTEYSRMQFCWDSGITQGEIDLRDTQIQNLAIALSTANERIQVLERRNETLTSELATAKKTIERLEGR